MSLADNLAILKSQKSRANLRRKEVLSTLMQIAEERQVKDASNSPPVAKRSTLDLGALVNSGGAPGPSSGQGGHFQGDGHAHGSEVPATKGEAEELWNRLQRMLKEAPHKITPGARSRDYATQVRLWNNYKAGKGPQAARPGTSKHGDGRANDLQYSSAAARAWALANAGKYGLAFPIYNPNLPRSRDESWHVELARKR